MLNISSNVPEMPAVAEHSRRPLKQQGQGAKRYQSVCILISLHEIVENLDRELPLKLVYYQVQNRDAVKNANKTIQRQDFACNICDKRFRQRTHLEYHINTHTGAKPFACDQCDRSFSQTASLYRHKRGVHHHQTHCNSFPTKK